MVPNRRDILALSEVGSVQMEFFHLAYRTGNSEFADKPMKVFKMLRDNNDPEDGLYPAHIDSFTGNFFGESLILQSSVLKNFESNSDLLKHPN